MDKSKEIKESIIDIPIIIAAHGNLAKELLNSAEMIIGKQTHIDTISFLYGENTEDLKRKYIKCIENYNNSSEILILVDLYGGSPYNAAFQIAMDIPKVEIIAGVSLPMLIDILSERSINNTIRIDDILNTIKNNKEFYIRSFKEIQKSKENEKEEEL